MKRTRISFWKSSDYIEFLAKRKREKEHKIEGEENKMKKVKIIRTDWKKKYEEAEIDRQTCQSNRMNEYRNYAKQYKEMNNGKNFWLWIVFLALIFATFVIVVLSARIEDRDNRISYLEGANREAVNVIHNCQAQLTSVTDLYDKGYYEVINSADLTDSFFDCCYPSDCPEAVNNPVDCKCEYMLMCGVDPLW